jgi:hypothetical protein
MMRIKEIPADAIKAVTNNGGVIAIIVVVVIGGYFYLKAPSAPAQDTAPASDNLVNLGYGLPIQYSGGYSSSGAGSTGTNWRCKFRATRIAMTSL